MLSVNLSSLFQVISRQATINIGTIGHVAHGKSTVVKALSGVHTVRFKNELERNITIKLGYANAKIYKSDDPKCQRPVCYTSASSTKEDIFTMNGFKYGLVRHVSFVDCPGHDILMATMLNGAAVMDAALLLIAGNESCPQPQTSEHLAAIEIMKLKHILILQNKIDLIKEEQAREQHEQILKFIEGTVAEGAPVIPISAQLKYNIEVVCEYITKKIPVPVRDFTSEPRLIIIRFNSTLTILTCNILFLLTGVSMLTSQAVRWRTSAEESLAAPSSRASSRWARRLRSGPASCPRTARAS